MVRDFPWMHQHLIALPCPFIDPKKHHVLVGTEYANTGPFVFLRSGSRNTSCPSLFEIWGYQRLVTWTKSTGVVSWRWLKKSMKANIRECIPWREWLLFSGKLIDDFKERFASFFRKALGMYNTEMIGGGGAISGISYFGKDATPFGAIHPLLSSFYSAAYYIVHFFILSHFYCYLLSVLNTLALSPFIPSLWPSNRGIRALSVSLLNLFLPPNSSLAAIITSPNHSTHRKQLQEAQCSIPGHWVPQSLRSDISPPCIRAHSSKFFFLPEEGSSFFSRERL